MKIIDLTGEWLEQAQELIRQNEQEEREVVAALPDGAQLPPLEGLAENGLGAAAVEDGRLLGFLGAYGPWQPVFYTQDVRGVFSPLHAHAVQKENRVKIWRRLYQAAAEKWVRIGASSHAITLYAHDREAREALYLYGFGVRCMDLIRPLEEMAAGEGWNCFELPAERSAELTPLRRGLAQHLSQSPSFMRDTPDMVDTWLKRRLEEPPRMFAAQRDGKIAAYIEACGEGENYLSCCGGMMNINGAFCADEYRGTGAAQAVLGYMTQVFRREGFTCLGVDCESFNPTALGFWSKYFEAYTHSVVRRIDENALPKADPS